MYQLRKKLLKTRNGWGENRWDLGGDLHPEVFWFVDADVGYFISLLPIATIFIKNLHKIVLFIGIRITFYNVILTEFTYSGSSQPEEVRRQCK